MEHFFLQVFGMDSYSWLVLILLAITAGLLLICLWLAKSYTEARHRLHVVTTDSIMAYQKIHEAMNYIRQDLNNFTSISSEGNKITYKAIEHRLDRIDRALDELQRDLFRK
jgi:uncharacterized protein Yka (UPF0111/DUF47 family)